MHKFQALLVLSVCLYVSAQKNKKGVCPNEAGSVGICTTTCKSDSSCPGTSKCCKTGCGGTVCIGVLDSKPGSCPRRRGDCQVGCGNDFDCRGRLKCCFDACGGRACVRSLEDMNSSRPKPGRCPVQTVPGVCNASLCSRDNDCRDNMKCCRNNCGGQMCVRPVDVKFAKSTTPGPKTN